MPALSPGPRPSPGQPDQGGRLAEDGGRPPEDGALDADGADQWWARPAGWPGDEELAASADPYGEPNGPPAVLAGLTVPEREAYYAALEAQAQACGAAEVLEAGFADRAMGGGGPGFSAGGPADRLPPGPVLAGLTAQAWDSGLAGLDDDELVGVLLAARRLCSWQAALELDAVAELDRRRRAAAELERRRQAAARSGQRSADPPVAAHTSEELAVALTLTGRAADTLLGTAQTLARLPAVRDALATGTIDRPKAVVFADELALLDDTSPAAVAAAELGRAGRRTTGQLRASLRRHVLALDRDAARQRRARARADARVEAWDEASGNTVLAGRELPAAGVLAADKHLTALARALRAAGADGTLDQLRARTYLALLSGQDPHHLLLRPQSGSPGPGPPGPGGPGGECPGGSGVSRPGTGGSGLAWPAGPIGTIHLTMPMSAWLGLTDIPGHAAGHGPMSADDCRDLAGTLARYGTTRWTVTLTTDDGHPLAHARPRTGPPPASGRAPEDPDPQPGGPAPPGHEPGPPVSSPHGAPGPPGGGPGPPVSSSPGGPSPPGHEPGPPGSSPTVLPGRLAAVPAPDSAPRPGPRPWIPPSSTGWPAFRLPGWNAAPAPTHDRPSATTRPPPCATSS